MAKDKVVKLQKFERTVDYLTGEIIEEKKDYIIKKEKEPNYVKMYTNYVESISLLIGLPSYVNDVLVSITEKMSFDNTFFSLGHIRKSIAQETNLSMIAVSKAIAILKKKGILLSPDNSRGFYLVNPNLFARGNYEYIKEIKLLLTVDSEGKITLKSDFPQKIKEIGEKYGYY